MKEEDSKQVSELGQRCGLNPWTEKSYREEVQNQLSRYIILEIDDKIIGFVGIWCVVDEAQIMNIGIDPRFQSQGYGKKLMQEIFSIAREEGCLTMTLEVKTSNRVARQMYQSMGFELIGIRKKYYPDNSDCMLMCKTLCDTEGDKN